MDITLIAKQHRRSIPLETSALQLQRNHMQFALKTLLFFFAHSIMDLRNVFHLQVRPIKSLVICIAGHGDLLLSTGFIESLHQITDETVDVVINEISVQLLEGNPSVGKIWFYTSSNSNSLPINLTRSLNLQGYGIVFSMRTPIPLLTTYGYFGNHGLWVRHPLHEKAHAIKRLRKFFLGPKKPDYVIRKHICEINLDMLNIFRLITIL